MTTETEAILAKVQQDARTTAMRCRLQLDAFLDYGFAHKEAFELLKIVSTPNIQQVIALTDRNPKV